MKKASAEQVQEWKRKYDCKIFEFTAHKQGEEAKVAYFRTITPEVLEAWQQTRKKSMLQADEIIIENCWIDGDDCIRYRNEYKQGLRDWLAVLLDKVEGEMVEL